MTRLFEVALLGVFLFGCVKAPLKAAAPPASSGWSTISVGEKHTCGVQRGGTLWCWGEGKLAPKQVGTESDWLSVSAGIAHTCAVRRDGSLWCWGSGESRLGLGEDRSDHAQPTRVGELNGWTSVAAGKWHSCALRDDGSLWCWAGASGGAGHGEFDDRHVPTRVEGALWTHVTAAWNTTCGLQQNGSLWCWGNSSGGELGQGDERGQLSPKQVGDALGWRSVAIGVAITCAVKDDKTVWCWGKDSAGPGPRSAPSLTPQQVGTETSWAAVFPSKGSHMCATREDQSLWCWGSGRNGVLGLGDSERRYEPTRVAENARWSSGAVGAAHTCAIDADAALWCWGLAEGGRLGIGRDSGDKASPTPLETSRTVKQIAAGDAHGCFVANDDTLWCWGDGQIGVDAYPRPRAAPAQVGADADWRLVSTGHQHTCALKQDGSLWCWGGNGSSQLGFVAPSVGVSVPGRVGPEQRWTTVSAGGFHTCAIREDKTVWCWGLGEAGQLGAGAGVAYSEVAPVQAGPTSNWVAISLGKNQSCGLRADGTLWCWGGVRRRTPAGGMSPQPVGTDTDWRSISTGEGCGCGLKRDGALWCWGESRQPTKVGDGWASVSEGKTQRCGTKTDGSLWCWGTGPGAQPTRVGRETDWLDVAAGGEFTLGVRRGGAGFAWGRNQVGQLGDGTLNRTRPTPVAK
ncbi:MAG: hypothetical protein Q8S33_12230 [Myxococcales bacterium]|nr:hypothetical protein [Myxococcales bacterium]